jgi:hypothetical protein
MNIIGPITHTKSTRSEITTTIANFHICQQKQGPKLSRLLRTWPAFPHNRQQLHNTIFHINWIYDRETGQSTNWYNEWYRMVEQGLRRNIELWHTGSSAIFY